MVNRGVTWGALGAIALATTVGVSMQSGGGRTGSGEQNRRNATTNSDKPASRRSKGDETDAARACDDLASQLALFLKVDHVTRPESCFGEDDKAPYGEQKPLNSGDAGIAELRFVIATVPDPIHTQLALIFDRYMEVIQQAAQDENYVYEVSWLPWETKEQAYQRIEDDDRVADRKDLREKQPGILIFRNGNVASAPSASGDALVPYRDGLVVFVVGEDPTRGIHTEQFTNAVEWIEELKKVESGKPAPSYLGIFGPSFSGSLPSLAKLLKPEKSSLKPDELVDPLKNIRNFSKQLPVYSGSANSAAAIGAFRNLLGDKGDLQMEKVDFRNFMELDEVALERFCEYGRQQGFLTPETIAVISEDETPFGSANKQKYCMKDALWFPYPRDISGLRAAYQTNSLFNMPMTPQTSPEVQQGRLPTDLADPAGNEHDTIPSFAGNQKPMSQEAYLLGIANAMRIHHSQYVILHSTNSFDQLFLARYFRRAYPDARIVTDSVDRLFERESGAIGMGGTMAISTYPLIERERAWVSDAAPDQGTHRLFDSEYSEASYIAFRNLLKTPALNHGKKESCLDGPPTGEEAKTEGLAGVNRNCALSDLLPDYGLPTWLEDKKTPRRPATWLSVLGKDGYWAIAALNDDTVNQSSPNDKSNAQAVGIPLSLVFFLLFFSGVCLFHAWCCRCASFTQKPAFRTYFAIADDIQSGKAWDKWRHPLLVHLGSMFLGLIALFIARASGMFSLSGSVPGWMYAWVVVQFVIVWTATTSNIFRVDKLNPAQATPSYKWRMVTIFSLGPLLWLFLFVVGYGLPMGAYREAANEIFTRYRSLHLTSGVSPLVPLFALTGGLYLWFWFSLHGLALFGPDRTKLSKSEDLLFNFAGSKVKLDFLRMFSSESALETENDSKPLGKYYWSFAAVVFVILLVVILAINDGRWPVHSLGAAYYSNFFLCWLLVCASLMLMEAYQLLKTWTRLRELLVFLDRLALRRTLSALRGFSWGSVWAMSGNVLDVRYKLLSRQLECLGHLLTTLQRKVDREALQEVREAVRDERDKVKSGQAPRGVDTTVKSFAATLNPPPDPKITLILELEDTRERGVAFAKWYGQCFDNPRAGDLKSLAEFQDSVARVSGQIITELLIPEWTAERHSLILEESAPDNEKGEAQKSVALSKKAHIRSAEEFVCLPYLGFVQNILGRIRTLIMSIVWMFVASAVAVASYPFDPRQGLSGGMIALFVALCSVIVYVYAQMHRDSTLSHVTNTTPGELGWDFWLKTASFGLAPLLGLLATIFPQVSDFVFSWLQPGLQSVK